MLLALTIFPVTKLRDEIYLSSYFFQCVWNQLIKSRKHIKSSNQTKWGNVLFSSLTPRFLEKALIQPKLHKWPHKLIKTNFSLRRLRIMHMRTLKYFWLNFQAKLLLKKNQHMLINEILTAGLSSWISYSGNNT